MLKPKVFWPTVVILLVLCFIFYTQKEKEKSLRMTKVVGNDLEKAKREITARGEQIKLTLDKLEMEITARKDLEAQLVTAVKEKQDLATQIEELAAKLPKNIELEKNVVKPVSELIGRMQVKKQLSGVQIQADPPKLIEKTSPLQRKTIAPTAFWLMAAAIGSRTIAPWLIGLTLISSVGLLVWLFWRRYKLILDKDLTAQEVTRLKTQLQEQNQLLEYEQMIRKTIEETSLKKEDEFKKVKVELQKEQKLLEREEKIRKIKEEELSQKEKEVVEVKGSLNSLKEVLVERGIAKKLTTAEKEGEIWIAGKSTEGRESPRLDLSKDYNRTIILRIESPERSKSSKSFANDIGLGGLCFEARKDFEEKEAINLRLFFFGDKVPILKIKAEIIWKRTGSPVNHYGVCFVSLEDKNKIELRRYIESKIA